MRYLITGGSGMIGKRLTEMLLEGGHRVAVLSRSGRKVKGADSVLFDMEKGNVRPGAFEGVDCVVHLAGAGIVDKVWSEGRKREIVESRVKPLTLLADAFEENQVSPKVLISASGTGYYGFDTGERLQTEMHEPGSDYISGVAEKWEAAADGFAERMHCRVAKLRIGMVLSPSGGALAKMGLPVRMGLGSPLGSGEQWVSWIHIDDLCHLFTLASQKESYNGAFNAVSPNTERNKRFFQLLAQVLGRPIWVPNVPPAVLELILGERAKLVLGGNKVSADKVLANGFEFEFESLEEALQDVYKK